MGESKKTKTGRLYICATPIGNLSDISLRTLKVLGEVDLIAAEDTRNSIKLLNHFNIRKPLTSYHEHNRFKKADELVGRLLMGQDVALISDAGTPLISDPGEVLVQRCIELGLEVTSIPGCSAVINALILSGFSTRGFVFEGFLPPRKKKKARAVALARLSDETRTIVLYEAPHHLKATLEDLIGILGPLRRIALCREMTKIYETVIRTTLTEALKHEPRGEYVLVVEGSDDQILPEKKRSGIEERLSSQNTTDKEDVSMRECVDFYLAQGLSEKEAMKKVAMERGVSRRDIYNELKVHHSE